MIASLSETNRATQQKKKKQQSRKSTRIKVVSLAPQIYDRKICSRMNDFVAAELWLSKEMAAYFGPDRSQ